MPDVHPLLARLIEERKTRGITQAAIAKHIGISKTAMSEMEHGHHEPRMRTFIGYAEALGYEVLPGLLDRPDYPDDEAMAAIAAACTCAGCMTGGRCVDDGPDDSDRDDERNECEFCPDDCPICSGTPDCDCPTHGDVCDG